MMPNIVLASKSPRRKQLLELAEIAFEIIIADTEEDYPASLQVTKVPEYIALQKALAVQRNPVAKDKLILAADTIVTLDNKIIGKPADKADAISILHMLSGRTHRVISGVAMLYKSEKIIFHEITEVTFNDLTDEQIIYYIEQYKPYDKAGAYAIQEWIGATGIHSIKGDFYNVVGLPVSKVLQSIAALVNKLQH